MTRRQLLLPVLASLAVHAGAIALLGLATVESLPRDLFVVVSELDVGTIASGPRPAGAGAPTPVVPPAISRVRPSLPSARPAPAVPVPEPPPPPAAPAAPPVEREAPPPPPQVKAPEPTAPPAAPRQEWTAGAARESTGAPVTDGVTGGTASQGASSAERGAGAVDGRVGGTSQPTPPSSSGVVGGTGTNVAVAPSGPRGGEHGTEYGGYYARLRERIQESLRYPSAARRRGLKGTVHLEIVIRPDGGIGDVSVASSSSHRVLDEAAVETVRGLSPQPFPSNVAPRRLLMRLPVVFDLQ